MFARALLIGGALLVGLSIMLPWYALGISTTDLHVSMSGFDAREGASVALVVLAAVACAGLSPRPAVTLAAAAAVAVIVVASFVSAPAIPQFDSSGDADGGFFSATLSLDASRAWGLWVALAGAAALLAGAALNARANAAPRRSPERRAVPDSPA